MIDNLCVAPIYRYSSAPIDNFDGYTNVFFLKDQILDVYEENPYQWNGAGYWLSYAAMLMKRYHEKLSLDGDDHRDYRIWFDIVKGISWPDQKTKIEDLHLLLKQDNNGTMHLFSFKSLNPADIRHENNCSWELDGVY